LALTYNIVKRHGGEITVESRVGEGSQFTVLLPVSRE
jgi:two-component system, sporulation sensor kinase E